MRFLTVTVLWGLMVLAATPFLHARTWTDTAGRQIQAKFVRVVGDTVVLERAGKVMGVPFSSLSPDDQAYVRKETGGDNGPNSALGNPGGEPSPNDNLGYGNTNNEPAVGGDNSVWTDSGGNQVTARLIAFDGTTVLLETTDGQRAQFPLTNFSQADQQRLLNGPRTEIPADGSDPVPAEPYNSQLGITGPGQTNPGMYAPSDPAMPDPGSVATSPTPDSNPYTNPNPYVAPGSPRTGGPTNYGNSETSQGQNSTGQTPTYQQYQPPTYTPPTYEPPEFEMPTTNPPISQQLAHNSSPAVSYVPSSESSSDSSSTRVRVSGRSVRGAWKLIVIVIGAIGGLLGWLKTQIVGD